MCLAVFPHCYLSLHYLQSELSGVGRRLWIGCTGDRSQKHSNEEVGEDREGRDISVWVQLCGKALN